jgi:uncharacterized membrane protein YdjX (TVP38/TMEM64 family)
MVEARRAVYLQLAGFGTAIVLLAVISRFFPVVDLVASAQRRVSGLGAWSVICYPLLFGACNVLLLPGGILCVGAGFFFGLWWGFFVVLLGNSIGAAVAFWLSHSLGRRQFENWLSRSPMLLVLEAAVARDAKKIIFLSQLHPLFPTSLLNYLFGLTRIQFGAYMLWTTLGRAPGLFLYTYLGTLSQFGVNLARGKTHPRILEYWTWGGTFAITVLLFILLTRTALRALRECDAEASASSAASESQATSDKPYHCGSGIKFI